MYALGDFPQLIEHAQELPGYAVDLGTDLTTVGGCRRCRTQRQRQRDEALLGAVVQVALDAPAALIRCGDNPRARGHQLSPALRIRHRCRDQVGELRHPLLGVRRQWPLPGPDGDQSPQPAMNVDRHRDRRP